MLASVERLAKPSEGYPGKCGIGELCVRSSEIQTLTEVSHPAPAAPSPPTSSPRSCEGRPPPNNARMVFHMHLVGGRGSESEWHDLKG